MMNLFEALAAASQDSEKPDEPSFVHPEAQVLELQQHWKLLCEVHTFKPGDLVVHKQPQFSNNKYAAGIGLFIKMLDQPFVGIEKMVVSDASELSSTAAAEDYDCIVAYLIPRGQVIKFLSDSKELRLYEQAS